jgi:hypothetical protein
VYKIIVESFGKLKMTYPYFLHTFDAGYAIRTRIYVPFDTSFFIAEVRITRPNGAN